MPEGISQSAERFLRLVRQNKRGKLKIYLGMAAGSGKTYRMLLEAKELYDRGSDILVGYIEPHGRKETEKLADDLPAIAKKEIYYQGKSFKEFDLDAVLAQKPEIVLLDELAHNNAPAARNKKRWQDVLELLDNRISVFTTVNIQHLESLQDQVEKITGISVHEKVPQSVFHEADEIVHVDLPVEQLLQRLKDGKIYKGENIGAAMQNFFKEENLLLLRNLALKEAANHVTKKIRLELPPGMYEEFESIVAVIYPGPYGSVRVIKKASSLALLMNIPWFGLHIGGDSPKNLGASHQQRKELHNEYRLVSEQGGIVSEVREGNTAMAIVRFAEEKNSGLILLERPGNSLVSWLSLFRLQYYINRSHKKNKIDLLLISNENYKK